MANIKISELTALTPPDAADLVPVTDSSASQTKRTTVGEIVGIINGDVDVANNGTATISELPVSKLQDGAARQLLQTDAAGTGVEWTSSVSVASAAVSDLTSGRVVLAGTSGELEDSAGLTFNGTQLDVDGDVDIANAKEYRIAGTKVLDATSLGSGVVSSSLTSVGTIGAGVWQGTAIDAVYLDSTLVTTSDTGTVTSTMIENGTIIDADINGSAAIAGTKIAPNFGGQATTTTGSSTASSFVPTGASAPTNGLFLPTTNSVGLATNGTERLRCNPSGSQQAFSANDVYRAASGQSAGTSFGFYYGYHSATTTQNGTLAYLVFTNGNVQNTNNSYTGLSDIKLKENIVDANSQWSDIKALQVRNYNFKEGQTHTQIGLIAQEVELVSPGLVSESPDRDEDGNDLGTVTKSVNYSVLYMKAVKALQEAMERIETLEAKVAVLEGS